MFEMEQCFRVAAMRKASFRPGSMRKLKVAVLAVAMTFPFVAFVLRKCGNVP